MQEGALIPHLFRTEYSRICAVLTRYLGVEHMETAEDIASETFLSAMEVWPYKGIPDNPAAWLHTVAKNKTMNLHRRNDLFHKKVLPAMAVENTIPVEPDLSDKNIEDSMLRMLFTLCHPSIAAEAQIALSLRILCGFGIDEIATAFLSNSDTVEKRLQRAKRQLRENKLELELPVPEEIPRRLDTVLTTLYLLFSEGYYSEDKEDVIREELCQESMRLVRLLMQHELTNPPRVHALYALMCFHASRFAARIGKRGEMILYANQDESLWNQALISTGTYHLHKAAVGESLSRYHLEAGIAYWYTVRPDSLEKWEHILQLYNRLLHVEYAAVAALNRTYALSKVKGYGRAIREAESLNLQQHKFYHMLLGELYANRDPQKAADCFRKALDMTKTAKERQLITEKINGLKSFDLQVKSGLLIHTLLAQVIEIDRQTLPGKYVTTFEKLKERTDACPESFVAVCTEDQLLGYINFFPIAPPTLQALISGNIPNDTVLGRDDVIAYTSPAELDVYIITLAIRPEWQQTTVIRLLTRQFAAFIRGKSDTGVPIRHLYASVVSVAGEKVLRRMGFLPHPLNPHLFFTPASLLHTL